MKNGLGSYKVVALTLMAGLLFLTGCSSSGSAGNEGGASGEAAGETTASESTLEPYNIVMAYPSTPAKDLAQVQEAMSAITKEKINATVTLMPITFGAWSQQTNLMLAGNEKLDLMFTGSDFNYSSLVAKNQIIALDALLADYGQDITEQLAPEVLNASMVDGSIYGIPGIRDFAAKYGVVMRKDLVEKYGIDVSSIASVEDLTEVFKTIQENEPEMTPLVPSGQTYTFVEAFSGGMFDTLGDRLGVLPMDSEELKLVNFYESQEYMDLAKLVRSWYEAGYISKDVATSKESGTELVKADRAFAYTSDLKPGYEQQSSRLTGKPMVAVPLTPAVTTTSRITNVMMSIPRNSQDPERAMMFLNLLYTDKDLLNLLDNGIEGTHYVKTSDNMIAFPDGVDASTTGYASTNWLTGNNFMSYVWEGDDPEIWNLMKQFNDTANKSKALGITFNIDAVKTEVAAVNNVKNQYRMGIETGTLAPDEALPEFIEKLKAAGIDKIIAEKQRQMDEWASRAE